MTRFKEALIILATAALAAGCTDESTGGGTDAGLPDAAESAPDASVPATAVEINLIEHLGSWEPAQVRSILTTSDGAFAFVGEKAVLIDPATFGLDETPENRLRTGLLALNAKTGVTRLYTHADGLPTTYYEDKPSPIPGAPPFLDMAWVVPDKTFVTASWTGLVKVTVGERGELSFSSAAVVAPGLSRDSLVTTVGTLQGQVLAGTADGVAVLDPETLATTRWVDFGGGDFARPLVWGQSTGEFGGVEAAAFLISSQTARLATHVAILKAGAQTAEVVAVSGGEPLSVLGMKGRFLIGVRQPDGRGALMAVEASGRGALMVNEAVPADSLGAGNSGDLLPRRLAFDARYEKLFVGGLIDASTLGGGGLVEVPMSAEGVPAAGGSDLFLPRDPYRFMIPGTIDVLHVDGAGRLWFNGYDFCNELHLASSGLLRVDVDPPDRRLVRPIVSGVRAITFDPQSNGTWLALHDESRKLACDGIRAQRAICRMKFDGSCEIFTPFLNQTFLPFAPNPTVSAMDFGSIDGKELAAPTFESGLYVRRGERAMQVDLPITPAMSRYTTAAVWSEGALWLASRMTWEQESGHDEEAVNNNSPHGLGLLEFNDDGSIALSRRYVRKLPTGKQVSEAVAGLPSHTVWDVLPLPGKRRALAACGIERYLPESEHDLGEINEREIYGGLAIVDDKQVQVIAAPKDVVLTDVVALTRDGAGKVFALDAEVGVLVVDLEARTSARFAAPAWAAPERALSMAVDASGRIAVGTTRGLVIYAADGSPTRVLADAARGWVHRVAFDNEGTLLAGTDQGLTRIALDKNRLPVRGPNHMLQRELWELPGACFGDQDCACLDDRHCTRPLVCRPTEDPAVTRCQFPDRCALTPGDIFCPCGDDKPCVEGFVCEQPVGEPQPICVEPDPCVADPGMKNCPCAQTDECKPGLVCDTAIDNTCQLDPAACTAQTPCACQDSPECPRGWFCNKTLQQCARRQACDADCTCSTTSKCSDGLFCQNGMGGFTCMEKP